MDLDALRLLGALAGALGVAAVAVGAALAGGPRRRPAMTLGVTGGRVRLPSRAFERIALIALGLTIGLVLWQSAASSTTLPGGVFSVVALSFAVRRGALLAIAPREAGPDDAVDDGYVDNSPGSGDG